MILERYQIKGNKHLIWELYLILRGQFHGPMKYKKKKGIKKFQLKELDDKGFLYE